jgi:transaldolase
MQLFLDTADITTIKQYEHLLDGITTNPTHLARTKTNPTATIKEICALMHPRPVSVEVTLKEPEAVYAQAHNIAALADNIVVKIPCAAEYLEIIKRLETAGIPINVTLVFTLSQALMACKQGATYISPFIGRWDDIEVKGARILPAVRDMIDAYNYKSLLLAASLRSVNHVHDAITSQVDIATLPPELLEKMANHPLTKQGMELFSKDWHTAFTGQFP